MILAMEEVIERNFEELSVGQSAESVIEVTGAMVQAFAELSKDFNPIHFDDRFAVQQGLKARVAHGGLLVGFLSALIGTNLPGMGTFVVSMKEFKFPQPVYLGSIVITKVEIMSINRRGFIDITCNCSVEGQVVMKGEVKVFLSPNKNK